jgi:glycosidase
MEAIDPDIWMFGEVTATAQLSRRYGGVLDGVTDFPYAYGMRELLAGRLGKDTFAEIERESAAVLAPDEFTWVRFFDNHDMARAIHGWDGDESVLTHALEILLGLPGVPSFFYGTEQALSHDRAEDEGGLSVGRVPMQFDAAHTLFETTRRLVLERLASHNDQTTPVYWDDDGSRWRWGDLEGHL